MVTELKKNQKPTTQHGNLGFVPALCKLCGENISPGWFDKELLKNTRDLESLLLVS